MIFKCNTCNSEKTLHQTTSIIVGNDVVTKEAFCCNSYMEDISPDNGMPTIIRNERNGN